MLISFVFFFPDLAPLSFDSVVRGKVFFWVGGTFCTKAVPSSFEARSSQNSSAVARRKLSAPRG